MLFPYEKIRIAVCNGWLSGPCCSETAVCFVPNDACDRLIIPNGDDRSGMEVRDYFALLFSTDKFVGHNSLCVVRAAVVGEYRLACCCADDVCHTPRGCRQRSSLLSVTAVIPDRVTGQGGYCFVSTAMETCMMNKGKAETACQHERNQEK
jgi:hypothetical protein